MHFIFAHRDKNVNRLHVVYSTVHSREIMGSFIMAKECVRSEFSQWYQWHANAVHVSPLAVIGNNGMPMFTNGYQCFLPLAANLADNLERKDILQ